MAVSIDDRIKNDFAYHNPTTDAVKERHNEIRSRMGELAAWCAKAIPPGREQALVLTKLEEAMFWANAAVARTQLAP